MLTAVYLVSSKFILCHDIPRDEVAMDRAILNAVDLGYFLCPGREVSAACSLHALGVAEYNLFFVYLHDQRVQ